MSTSKKILITVATGMAVGAVLGILFAPGEGSETRKKLANLKRKITSCDCDCADDDKESLQEIKEILQKELDRINEKIDRLA